MSTRILSIAAFVLSAVSISAGYVLADLPWVSAIFFLIGALWIIVEIKDWNWPCSLLLFLLVLSAAVGIVVLVEPIWSILATVLALAAWELNYFRRKIQGVSWVRKEETLRNRHNLRVLALVITSTVLAWVTTRIQVDLGFGIALVLAIISLAGLSRAVVFLRRSA
jgi:hypothetical protein